jgi:hypothetical protein
MWICRLIGHRYVGVVPFREYQKPGVRPGQIVNISTYYCTRCGDRLDLDEPAGGTIPSRLERETSLYGLQPARGTTDFLAALRDGVRSPAGNQKSNPGQKGSTKAERAGTKAGDGDV